MSRETVVSLPAFLIQCAAVCVEQAAAQGSAREASPVGTTATAAISTGDEYTSSVEFYDGRVTVLQPFPLVSAVLNMGSLLEMSSPNWYYRASFSIVC